MVTIRGTTYTIYNSLMHRFDTHNKYIKLILGGVVLSFLLPFFTFAQTISVVSSATTYRTDTYITVTLVINTGGNSINTVSGKVEVLGDAQIVDARYGESIISLWVEKPTVNKGAGSITFSGGLPGGFNGSRGALFSVGLKTKTAGNVTIKPSDIHVLLNDGSGTELSPVAVKSVTLSFEKKEVEVEPVPDTTENIDVPPEPKIESPKDTDPPEIFTPIVSRHPDIGNNSYFVSFFAVDKSSGVSHYEISEKPFLLFWGKEIWVKSETPYILRHQWWRTKVSVRAFDQDGNLTTAYSTKPFHPFIMIVLSLLVALLIAVISYYTGVRAASRRHKNKVHFI